MPFQPIQLLPRKQAMSRFISRQSRRLASPPPLEGRDDFLAHSIAAYWPPTYLSDDLDCHLIFLRSRHRVLSLSPRQYFATYFYREN